ncbi:MAG: hypothetical protein E6J55_22220 [Deltaproteobacteria bacterium]|nr:MAG: hypothetical protein E6J55_22220 [Deltaproteobacteria bacterium]
MRSGLSLALAYRHVRAGLGRMVLSVAAVALGVALVVAIRLMNGAVLASFLDTVDAVAGRAAFHVTAGDGLTFSEDIVERVAAVPGVRLAVPLVTGVAFPDDESGELLSVYGVDLTHEADVRLYHAADDSGALLDDPILFLSRPDSILLARQFAERRGLTTGSLINLSTPGGVKWFTVRGLLDPEGVARTLGGRLVVMDLYAAERAFTADGQINQIDVVVLDDADVDATRRGVATALPPGLTAEETAVRKEVVRRTIGGFQAMVTAFGLLAVVGSAHVGGGAAARRWASPCRRLQGAAEGEPAARRLRHGGRHPTRSLHRPPCAAFRGRRYGDQLSAARAVSEGIRRLGRACRRRSGRAGGCHARRDHSRASPRPEAAGGRTDDAWPGGSRG